MSRRVRLRMRWDPSLGKLVEVPVDFRPAIAAPAVFGDLPGYESPVTGKWVEGRRARREDLKRTGSRPWEGMEVEKREAAKVQAERDRKTDQLAEKMAHRAWAEAPERVRRIFRGR
jgi:hypothetical protein